MRASIALAIVALLAVSASGRDIFVNNQSGNDTLTGRAPVSEGRGHGPVRTIAKAMRVATPGDRIILADTGEPYREQVTIQGGPRSGLSSNVPLIFDGGGAVIDGSVPVPDEAWEAVGGDIFRFAPDVKSHQSLLLESVPAVRVPVARGAAMPKLQPLQWCLIDGWIYIRVRPGEVPQQYHASCAGMWTGITVYDVHDVIVKNVTVRGFAFDGVNAHDNAFNVRLEDVKSLDNGRSGISVGGASRVRVVGCESAGNHMAQLRSEGYCRVQYTKCKFDETTAPALQVDGGRMVEE
jgi:hypothetical protein